MTAGTPAALAVGEHAPSIPLVMVAVGDPIGNGFVASLARPGGNATGLTLIAPDLEGKRLELIREMLPNVSRLATFWNPANAYQLRDEMEVRAAAEVLRIPVLSLAVRDAAGLEPAFAEILAQGADAMLVLADRVFLHNREPILAFAAEHRRPVMSAYRELAEGGGLMSFGPSYAAMHRQAARYVDKILKGEKPAELPIEQPARFELVINLKSAKALGISVPHPPRPRRRGDRMRRREVLAGLAGAVLAATHASGQARARDGWLTVAPHPGINGFLGGMRELDGSRATPSRSSTPMRRVGPSDCRSSRPPWRAARFSSSWHPARMPSSRRVRTSRRNRSSRVRRARPSASARTSLDLPAISPAFR